MSVTVSTPEITCDDAHIYRVDGVVKPGVTEVLSLFADFARVPKDVLEYKRALGKSVHKCIEYYESGELDMDSVPEAALPYLCSWQAFKEIKPLRVIRTEFLVYSKRYGYCGRGDLVWEYLDAPGKLWLVDGKCVYTMAPATALQTAGYVPAYEETFGEKIHGRAGLQLQPDGSIAKLYVYKDRNDFNVFANALAIRNWILNHK